MFEESVAMSEFTANSGLEAVEKRAQQLQQMIQAVNARKMHLPTASDVSGASVSFKSFLGDVAVPPKIEPIRSDLRHHYDQIQPIVEKCAAENGVDPKLINAIIRQESGFNPNAVSRCGAKGLMQLMPGTARSLGVHNAFDPAQNIEGGVRYFSGLLQKYQGNVPLALAAYNAGSGAVSRYNGIPPYKETQHYVRRILTAYLSSKNTDA